jgi:hypothetical protein
MANSFTEFFNQKIKAVIDRVKKRAQSRMAENY